MFDKIKELSFELNSDADFSKYKNVRDHRKLLQEIKIEAQNLRNKLTELSKNKS